MKRRTTCSIKGCFEETEITHMLHLKGTETHPASYTPWPVPGRSKACPLGPGGRAVLSCESRVYFANLPSPPRSPTPRFTRPLRASLVPPPKQGREWSHSTPRLLHLVFNHAVKEFSLQRSPDPCCPLHPHSPAHSHTWIPAITSLGSELQTHTSSPVHPPHCIFLTHISESAFCSESFHGAHIFRANPKLFSLNSSLLMVLQR